MKKTQSLGRSLGPLAILLALAGCAAPTDASFESVEAPITARSRTSSRWSFPRDVATLLRDLDRASHAGMDGYAEYMDVLRTDARGAADLLEGARRLRDPGLHSTVLWTIGEVAAEPSIRSLELELRRCPRPTPPALRPPSDGGDPTRRCRHENGDLSDECPHVADGAIATRPEVTWSMFALDAFDKILAHHTTYENSQRFFGSVQGSLGTACHPTVRAMAAMLTIERSRDPEATRRELIAGSLADAPRLASLRWLNPRDTPRPRRATAGRHR